MKYILDTNIVARLLDGDERVLEYLNNIEPSDVGIPILVLAELLFGAEKSARREQNHLRVRKLTEMFPIVSLGPAVARRYAVVRTEVESKGRPRLRPHDRLFGARARSDPGHPRRSVKGRHHRRFARPGLA